jgi:hypothetical protein
VQLQGSRRDGVDAADARADDDPRAVLLVVGLERDPGVLDGLVGGGHCIEDEVVYLPAVLGSQDRGGIEGAFDA